MSVLVTGAGLVAVHVAAELLARDEHPVLLARGPNPSYVNFVAGGRVGLVRADLRDLPSLIATIKKDGVTRIIHTAALLHGASLRSPSQTVDVNIVGSVNVLEAARLTGISRVVSYATVGMFDHRVQRGTIREDHPVWPESLYAVTKLSAELLGLKYRELFGLEFVSLRIPPIYGPMPEGVGSAGGGALVQDLVRSGLRGETVALKRSFLNQNEFLYAPDAARAGVLAAFAAAPIEPIYNVGSGRLTPLPELVQVVQRLFPSASYRLPDPVLAPNRPIQTEPMDPSLAQRDLGFAAEWPLERGLVAFAEWLPSFDLLDR